MPLPQQVAEYTCLRYFIVTIRNFTGGFCRTKGSSGLWYIGGYFGGDDAFCILSATLVRVQLPIQLSATSHGAAVHLQQNTRTGDEINEQNEPSIIW